MVAIRGAAWDEMVRHCIGTAPAEAVGMLAGRHGVAERCEPLRNIAPAGENRRAFLADPYDQFIAERRIAASGLELIAIYHSHPGGGTDLSAEDIVFSRDRACLQVVVAISTGTTTNVTMRAFRMVHDRAIEIPIMVQR